MQKYQRERHHYSTNTDENGRLGSRAYGRILSSASEQNPAIFLVSLFKTKNNESLKRL